MIDENQNTSEHWPQAIEGEKDTGSTYLGLSIGGRGEEGIEALLLEEVGGQAGEAVPGVEGDLNQPRRKKAE